MDIAAISFDLDDTLWAFAPARARAEVALHGWLLAHAPTTAAVLPDIGALSRYRQMSVAKNPSWCDRPDLVRRDSIRCILDAASADRSLAGHAYEVFYAARQDVELYDDVLPSLRCLSRRYPLIAITNGNSDLDAAGVGEFFRGTVTAYCVGSAKPDARIFHAAAEALRLAPHRILHVGDDFDRDVSGAKAAGLQAAWLVRPPQSTAVPQSGASAQPDLIVRSLHELCEGLDLPSHHVPHPATSTHPGATQHVTSGANQGTP